MPARQRAMGAVLALVLGVGCAQSPTPEAQESGSPDAGVAPLVERGQAALEAGDWDTAIDAYEQALERTPWNSRLERQLAVSYAERASARRAKPGEQGLRAAEADLRKALELAPDDATVRRNLGVVLLELAPYELDPALAQARRDEGAELAPDVETTGPQQLRVERRLDLAYELIERGQVDVGIRRLESLHRDHPQRDDVTRLLAQAHVHNATRYADRRDHARASGELDRAVALYATLVPCDGQRCDPAELYAAHHNRVVALLEAEQLDAARLAAADAEQAGVDLSVLRSRFHP